MSTGAQKENGSENRTVLINRLPAVARRQTGGDEMKKRTTGLPSRPGPFACPAAKLGELGPSLTDTRADCPWKRVGTTPRSLVVGRRYEYSWEPSTETRFVHWGRCLRRPRKRIISDCAKKNNAGPDRCPEKTRGSIFLNWGRDGNLKVGCCLRWRFTATHLLLKLSTSFFPLSFVSWRKLAIHGANVKHVIAGIDSQQDNARQNHLKIILNKLKQIQWTEISKSRRINRTN